MEKEKSLMIQSDNDYTSVAYNNNNKTNENNMSKDQENTTKIIHHKLLHTSTLIPSSATKNDVVDTGFENKCTLISTPHNSQVPAATNVSHATIAASNNNSVSSPKMGSRRIFTPQFKLQVLESYRNDNDCKGNQRATARKYNIHRRQIQKWLQCEPNLRSSVANINQSNVKHQFHNISHHHHQHQSQQLQMQIAATNNNNNSSSNFSHHHHLHHQQHQLSLDTARHTVALNSMTVPSLSAGVAGANAPTQGVLAAANLAAVVAAAAAAGAAGVIAIASTSSTNTSNTASPLRPTAIGGSSCATMSPSMLHPHHHHHHYPMPYTHTPASVSVSMPILTHHMPPQHLHHHYQYHNLSPHAQAHALPQAHHQPSAFMPSTCLPATVMSAAAAATTAAVASTAIAAVYTPVRGEATEKGEEHRTSDELRESLSSKATTAITATLTGNSYVHSDEYAYKCTENNGEGNHESKYQQLHQYPYMPQSTSLGLIVTPMDLSLGPRRDNKLDKNQGLRNLSKHVDIVNHNGFLFDGFNNDNSVVDLTLRKRKVVGSHADTNEQPEKLLKFSTADFDAHNSLAVKTEATETDASKENGEDANDNDDIIVEVEQLHTIKPVKLFKPYLLDDGTSDEDKLNIKITDFKSSELEPIVWSSQPACLSPHNYGSQRKSSLNSHFQLPSIEKYTFPVGSQIFQRNKPSSPQSALSFTSTPALSPTSFRCPKGSPVSGYESSSSTYSESSFRSEPFSCTNTRTYSLDLQMHARYTDSLIPRQNHVQKWLDEDTSTTPPKTAISLYASNAAITVNL